MEAKRLLKENGVLFFNEEPIKQSYNLQMWRRPTKLRLWEKPLKWIGILHFISQIGKTETDAGILETSFDLNTWEQALNHFGQVNAKLTVFPFGPTKSFLKINNTKPGWLSSSHLINILVKFLGGNIQAICQK
jgi:hypothetical protein